MSYKIEDNCITETVDEVFDNQGRKYYLETNYISEHEYKSQAVFIFLVRNEREKRVGKAYCILKESKSLLLADLIISADAYFENLQDKFFKLTHWFEPTDYRRKGLGSYLLKFIINLAKNQGIKKIYGSLTEQDIEANPNLINWYQKYGFKLEAPTSEEVETAKYRICLDLD